MPRRTTIALTLAATVTASAALAQNAPPSYQADPDVYKVIFEDANFRVISATWKKGSGPDKSHSHPQPFVVYALDDCKLRIRNPDGTSREVNAKAGAATAGPITVSHTAENIGDADCHTLQIERK